MGQENSATSRHFCIKMTPSRGIDKRRGALCQKTCPMIAFFVRGMALFRGIPRWHAFGDAINVIKPRFYGAAWWCRNRLWTLCWPTRCMLAVFTPRQKRTYDHIKGHAGKHTLAFLCILGGLCISTTVSTDTRECYRERPKAGSKSFERGQKPRRLAIARHTQS